MVAGVGLALGRVTAVGVVVTGRRPSTGAGGHGCAVASGVETSELLREDTLETDEGGDGDGDQGYEDGLLGDQGDGEVGEGGEGAQFSLGDEEKGEDFLDELLLSTA